MIRCPPTPGLGWNLWIEGDVVYVADYADGLQILSIADPTAPVVLGHFGPGEAASCGG